MEHETIQKIIDGVKRVILGKDEAIQFALAALLADGHLLIEDVPGLGKTLLAKTLARSLNATFKRVQFTPDLLPTDITGVSIYNQKTQEFEFVEGPIFTNILLADEINRATPRTQSSLLEGMEERQVTVDGKTYPLPRPFFVIATQNPIEQQGVYHLPEAQLDRFLMRIHIGYPEHNVELRIIKEQQFAHPIEKVEAVVTLDDVVEMQKKVKEVYVEHSVRDYMVQLVEKTREHKDLLLGASPRASLALFRVSQAIALINGKDFVTPDIVQRVAKPVLRHRLILQPHSQLGGITPDKIIEEIIQQVEVPVREYH
ncbi:MoxR family ATPase [Candidatus Sumerlaeota bacterium]|nr:MoxR family ATPase [Candidatus Sumerlaeota bacterium]